MATHTIGKFMGIGRFLAARSYSMPRCYSLYTPDYLETGKSKIPLHSILNVKIQGYTYPVLESYQKFIDALAEHLDIEVEDSWAFPPKNYAIQRFKPNTSVAIRNYALTQYERDIQLQDVSATKYPILLRALEAALPEGVTLTVEYFDPLYEKKRYVPDTDLLHLKEELSEIGKK